MSAERSTLRYTGTGYGTRDKSHFCLVRTGLNLLGLNTCMIIKSIKKDLLTSNLDEVGNMNHNKEWFAVVVLIGLIITPQLSVETTKQDSLISGSLQNVEVGDSTLNVGFDLVDPWGNRTLAESVSYDLLVWAEDAGITSYPGRYVNWPSVTVLVGWKDPEVNTSMNHNLGKLANENTNVDNNDWGADRIENELMFTISDFYNIDPGQSIPNAWIAIRFTLSEYRGLTNLDPHGEFDCNVSIHLLGQSSPFSEELMRLFVVAIFIFGGLAGVLVLLRLTKKG